MIGEWMVGSSDESLLCSALITCKNQTDRGKACFNYLKTVYSYPNMVGAHYFEYNDQPLLGRFDGEAMPHGLIDVCNQPKDECIAYFTRINNLIYDIACGTEVDVVEKPKFLDNF